MSDLVLDLSPVRARQLYPQAEEKIEGRLDRIAQGCRGFFVRRIDRLRQNRYAYIVQLTKTAAQDLEALNAAALLNHRHDLSIALRRSAGAGFRRDLVGSAFALVNAMAKQSLGISLTGGQLMASAAVLDGNIVEMATGEDEALAAALAASTAALTGMPTHIVCANDDLAARDGGRMAPLYQALGLSVGIIGHEANNAERRAAYRCNVTYGASAEFAFDHLRDRMVLGAKSGDIHLKLDRLYGEAGRTSKLLMRGFGFAIINDAGAVLLDQAVAPQSISGAERTGHEKQVFQCALGIADSLIEEIHFKVFKEKNKIEITDPGTIEIQNLIAEEEVPGSAPIRIDMVREALMAYYLFTEGEQYIVQDGQIFILDKHTGQPSANRQWSGELQQLIEVKEGCEPSDRRVILARMSYQRYFQRYLKLGGLSDAVREAASEIWRTYRVSVIAIPASREMHHRDYGDRVYVTALEKTQAIVARALEISEQGRPVFIAVPSVEAATAITESLRSEGIAHNDLVKATPEDVVRGFAMAGQPRVITVSANLVGVGIDIEADPVSTERGGLHVIIGEAHESYRVDRWLAQRSGRGGVAGSHERFLSLEDSAVSEFGGGVVDIACKILTSAPAFCRWSGIWLARYAVLKAQRKIEQRHRELRWELLMYDRETRKLLAFSGQNE